MKHSEIKNLYRVSHCEDLRDPWETFEVWARSEQAALRKFTKGLMAPRTVKVDFIRAWGAPEPEWWNR